MVGQNYQSAQWTVVSIVYPGDVWLPGNYGSLPLPSIMRVSYCMLLAWEKIKIQNSKYSFYWVHKAEKWKSKKVGDFLCYGWLGGNRVSGSATTVEWLFSLSQNNISSQTLDMFFLHSLNLGRLYLIHGSDPQLFPIFGCSRWGFPTNFQYKETSPTNFRWSYKWKIARKWRTWI